MKYFVVILILTLASVTTAFKESTADLEQILMDILSNKTRIEDTPEIRDLTGKECFATAPDKPNFLTPGRRISEAKCAEYNWTLHQKKNEKNNIEKCRIYLIREIQKGTVPEIFFLINSPVIFGGRPAHPGEFPHMGAVGWQSKTGTKRWIFKCGSSLISENFVLTAAHCTHLSLRIANDIADPTPKIVRFGVENIGDDAFNVNGDPIDLKIARIIVHPQYAPPKKYYDIALMKLENKVNFDQNIIPACLWTNHDTSTLGNEVVLTGWGYTEKGHLSEELQAANVSIIDSSLCDSLLRRKRNRHWQGFASHQICAGNLTGGVDTCQGDSGGPMQVRLNPGKDTEQSVQMVIGVTSFGIKCAMKGVPGIYTRVSSFIDWIEDTVWRNQNNTSTKSKRRRRRRRKYESRQ